MDAVVRLSDGAAERMPAVSPTAVSPAPVDRVPRAKSQKAGVVLAYRPRDAAGRIEPKPVAAVPVQGSQPTEACVIIYFAGHEYVTRESMADLFLRSAGRVVVNGESQSVPLLHEDGVDLLFITPTASVRVTRMSGDS